MPPFRFCNFGERTARELALFLYPAGLAEFQESAGEYSKLLLREKLGLIIRVLSHSLFRIDKPETDDFVWPDRESHLVALWR